jgi:hypothetical protein
MLRRSLVVLAAVLLAFTAASCSDSEGSIKDFCSLESDKSLQDSDDPADLAKALDEAKDKAPDEIKGDVEILADAFGEMSEATEGLDPTEDAEEYAAAVEEVGSEKVQKAADNIEKFSKENCEKE